MTEKQRAKPVTVRMSGGGKEFETVVEPGDTPREVLAKTVGEQEDQFSLRPKGGTRDIPGGVNLFKKVGDGEELTGVPEPKVGDGRDDGSWRDA
jgi:hypothetical protein